MVIKLLEENIGRTHFDINHSNIFLYPPPGVVEKKPKRNKWDLIKLKSFCTAKETINKKTTHRMGENICKPCDRQGINLQNLQRAHAAHYHKNNPIKKCAEDLNRHFSKENMQMAKKHMKSCSTSLITREMQIKTTMRYHFTPVRMAIIKNLQAINAGQAVEKREPSYTVGGNVNWYSHYAEQHGGSLKN